MRDRVKNSSRRRSSYLPSVLPTESGRLPPQNQMLPAQYAGSDRDPRPNKVRPSQCPGDPVPLDQERRQDEASVLLIGSY